MDNHFVCPHCKKTIKITEALSHQLDALKKEVQEEARELKKQLEEKDRQLLEEKKVMWVKAQAAAEKKFKEQESDDLKLLKEQLQKQDKKLEEARQAEIELRRERVKLEEEKKEQELKLQRKLDEERRKIAEDAFKKAQEEQELKNKEKDLVIDSLKKSLEEAKRKAEVNSQQRQGEVLELELEDILKREYPSDLIQPVPKGIRGADVIQVVKNSTGATCGKIIWESKRTKAWTPSWIPKLRADQREVGADMAVIISIVLPEAIKNFGEVQGVWVAEYDAIVGLSLILREMLISIARHKSLNENTVEKQGQLYNYVRSTGFKHNLEAILETYFTAQEDIEREKRWFTSKWARQDANSRKAIDSVARLVGSMHSIIGKEFGEIKGLGELPSGEDKSEEDRLF